MTRAREALAAARHLRDGGFYADAVSRSYYASYHAAHALLISIGRTSKTHDGVRHMVSEHFIKTGLMRPELGRAFSHAASDRDDADYDAVAVFTLAAADDAIRDAEAFLAAAATHLSLPA